MLNIKGYEAMAKLSLTEDERMVITCRAEMLNSSFAALNLIETENTEPLVTVLELNNVLREDIAQKLLSRDEILSNAPEQSGGYFKVPGTLE